MTARKGDFAFAKDLIGSQDCGWRVFDPDPATAAAIKATMNCHDDRKDEWLQAITRAVDSYLQAREKHVGKGGYWQEPPRQPAMRAQLNAVAAAADELRKAMNTWDNAVNDVGDNEETRKFLDRGYDVLAGLKHLWFDAIAPASFRIAVMEIGETARAGAEALKTGGGGGLTLLEST